MVNSPILFPMFGSTGVAPAVGFSGASFLAELAERGWASVDGFLPGPVADELRRVVLELKAAGKLCGLAERLLPKVGDTENEWKRALRIGGCLRGFDVESTASIWCGFYRENYSEPLFIDIMGISGIKGYNFLRLEPGKTHYSCLLFTLKYMNSIHIVYYFHGDLNQHSIWTFSDCLFLLPPRPQHICRKEAPVSEGRLLLIWMTRESQKERWLVPNWGTQRLLHAQYWCMPSNMVLNYLSTTSAYGTFYAHVLPTPLQAMDDLGWMSIEVAWQHWGNIRYFDIWFGVDLMFCIRKERSLESLGSGLKLRVFPQIAISNPSLLEGANLFKAMGRTSMKDRWGKMVPWFLGHWTSTNPKQQTGLVLVPKRRVMQHFGCQLIWDKTKFLGTVKWTSNLYFIVLFEPLDVSCFLF